MRGTVYAVLFGFSRGQLELRAFNIGVVSFTSDCKAFVSPRTGVTFAYASADCFVAAI